MKALMDSLLVLAKTVAPLIVPGAEQMIEVGQKLVETIDHAKATFEADTPAELDAVREELDARIDRVNDAVDATVAKLRGSDGGAEAREMLP